MKHPRILLAVQIIGLAIVYFAAARLGLRLASVHTSVSPVWPPTGIAIGAVLLLGYRMWPGIFLGAFLVNLMTPVSVATAGGIAVGNTIEAVAVGFLLGAIGFRKSLDRATDVLKFAIAIVLCAAVGATIGNLSLCLGHAATWEQFGPLWLTWWLGDTGGGLIAAPLLLAWGTKPRDWMPPRRLLETGALVLLLAGAAMVTFGGPAPVSIHYYPLARLIVPFFLWAAFRLGVRGVTLANLTLSVFAVWGATHGVGPFIGRTPNESLLLLQVFIGSNAITFMFLVAAVEERRHSETIGRRGEEQLRLALNAANMGTWSFDIKAKSVKWSATLEQIHGLTPGSFGGTFDDYQHDMHPEDRQRVLDSLAQTIADGAEHAIEYRIIRPDGEIRWVEGKGRVIRDRKGNPLHVTGVCLDITDRKQAEAERAEFLSRVQKARLEAEQATESITRLQSVTDTALQHLTLDDLLHEMLVRVRDLLGTDSVAILLLSEDGSYLAVRSALGLEERVANEVRVPIGSGIAGHIAASRLPLLIDDLSQVEVVTSLLRDEIRSLIGAPLIVESRVLGVIHADKKDLASFSAQDLGLLQLVADRIALAIDHARLYEAERKARVQAETANRAKDDFLATVSHELRTPLNAIVGWCGMLKSGKLDQATFARAIEIVDRNAKVQAHLIEDILDVSRIIRGQLGLDPRPVEVLEIVEAAVDSLRLAADSKGIRLRCQLDAGTGPILGDPKRLQQIVWNVLSNAVKFTPGGGQVEVRLKSINSHVEVKVSDTGQGISSEFLPYVFEQFRQADSATTRRYGGLGLGLAIARHLVELHGGTIRAESAGEEQGAVFTIQLPLVVGVEQTLTRGLPDVVEGEGGALHTSLAGLRVLVVDDERDARDLLTTMLSDCDAQVRTAASANEAMAMLADWRPDILISDIEMPEVDGYALIRELRALDAESGGQVPAVALTAHARVEDRLRALQAGFQVHVSKPVEPRELTLAVAGLTGRIDHR